MLFGFTLVGLGLLCISYIDWSYFEDVFDFAFELFINYSEEGEFSSTSTDGFMSSLYLPSPEIFILGSGQYDPINIAAYTNVEQYTDCGYIRQFVYWGIFSLVYYGVFIFMARKSMIYSKNAILKFMFLILWGFMFVIQIKGNLFVESYQCLSVLYVLYFGIVSFSVSEDLLPIH